jgi:hypothetical protein
MMSLFRMTRLLFVTPSRRDVALGDAAVLRRAG